jgi:REP element-mobilizing transposase RayT
MPRRCRDDAPYTVHHVIQRGNNRNYIYEDIRDKREFFEILQTEVAASGAAILQYVLMDNHYHLLVRVGEQSLAGLMRNLNRRYTMYYNQRYNRIGTIYGGRYKSYPLVDNQKFYSTVRYIVRNPVKAGLVATPAQYRWSGHLTALKGGAGIIDRPALLAYFSPDAGLGLKCYVECTEHEGWTAKTGFATIVDRSVETQERLTCLLDGFLSERNPAVQPRTMAPGTRPALPRELRNSFMLLAIADGHALKDIAAFLHVSHETVRRVGKKTPGTDSTAALAGKS